MTVVVVLFQYDNDCDVVVVFEYYNNWFCLNIIMIVVVAIMFLIYE